jgi:hypothetical protein
MDILFPEYRKMLALLIKHEVKFMLIGGYAVIFHGYERLTTDMDIFLEPENDNRDRLMAVLKEFGIGSDSLNKLSALDFKKIQIFHFGERPGRIDFLTKINLVTFKEAAKEAKLFSFGNLSIPIIQYHHLILSKMTTDRAQDKADVEMLQKIGRMRKSRKK